MTRRVTRRHACPCLSRFVCYCLPMTSTRTATRRPARIAVRRRNGLGLTDARVAEYVAARTIARHRLADGTLVRAEIVGRSRMVRSYLSARIVDGELAGRTVTLGNRIAVEVAA